MKIKNMRKFEMLADFLIKFNLLAIPMYVALFVGINFYPLQMFLTDVVYGTFKSEGYWISRSGITLMLFAPPASSDLSNPPGPPLVETIVMGFDCTAWKTMYAFAALVIATPVAGMRKKLKFILLGSVGLFLINIVRLVTTIKTAYTMGFQYLDITHTFLWREGLIVALLAIWFFWLRNQKNNISQGQTILRRVYPLFPVFYSKAKRLKPKQRLRRRPKAKRKPERASKRKAGQQRKKRRKR